jgi:diguanylate cyclase (GGDEF)-like protein/PAS domain S-box-containing protein
MSEITSYRFSVSSLKARQIALFVAGTITGVALLAMAWKFGIEEWVDPFLPGTHHEDSEAERWEFVIACAMFTGLGLALPIIAYSRLAAENLAAARLSRDVFVLAPQPMVVTSSSGLVLAVNQAWESFTGLQKSLAVGVPIANLCEPVMDVGMLRRVVESVDHAGAWAGEVQGMTKAGSPCWSWLAVNIIKHDEERVRNQVWSFSDITAQKLREASAEHAALHDPLTGLPNRRLLYQRLERAFAFYRQTGGGLAVLFIDLDGFKPVNDIYGHDVGDQALRESADRIRRCARVEDSVARFGGDEFVILAGGVAGPEDVAALARRCIQAFQSEITVRDGVSVRVGASVGIAIAGQVFQDAEALIRAADEAMYVAKRNGGRCYVFAGDNR